MKKSLVILSLLTLVVVLFSGCADVSPHAETCVTSDPYGFWGGLWHGLILPFSWIGSLFSDNIAIYALDNNGGWYDFGFFLGVGGLSLNAGFWK
ncbi:MAG: hypothetical protein ACOCVF_01125 [bacterium]